MSIDATAYSDPSYFKVSLQTPMAVAVAGGADAGKHDVCELLMKRLSGTYEAKVAIISLTDFYRELNAEERTLYEAGKFNLDHPNAFDLELLEESVKSLLSGNSVTIPVWDAVNHTRVGSRVIEPVDVILVEGTLVLYAKALRQLMFMKVFIDVDSDQRLSRRVCKPHSRSGRVLSVKEMLTEYVEFVKPMFDEFVWPTKKYADIIIPRGAENTAALQVLANHLEDHLRSRSNSSMPDRKMSQSQIWIRRKEDDEETQSRSSSRTGSSIRNMDPLATTADSSYKQIPQ